MSQQLTAAQQIFFDESVKLAYQNGGLLRKFVRYRTGFTGSSVSFRRYGRGQARIHLPNQRPTPMSATLAPVSCPVRPWRAADYIDQSEMLTVNFDEKPIVANNAGMAIGRREDQMLIDAMDAAINPATIAHGGTGMDAAKLRRVNRFFSARGVPRGDRTLAISAAQEEDILAILTANSRADVDEQAEREGTVGRRYGLNIVVIEDRAGREGGLPLSGTTRTCFAFDRQAVGLASNLTEGPVVTWMAPERSWLVDQMMQAGACVIDPDGVLEIQCTEALI